MNDRSIWVFGYGSLIWRPSFEFAERRVAQLNGFERRFWQGSTDHRGIPQAPGRVVTLIENPSAICIGIAYRITEPNIDDVLSHLDHREKGGYERRSVSILLDPPLGNRVSGLVYFAGIENPEYLGAAPIEQVAKQIHHSVGPSGPNREYALRLADALRAIKAHDEHVFEVEQALLNYSNS